MGCAASGPAVPDKSIDMTRAEAARQQHSGADPQSQRVTSSGYVSDLQADRAAFTHAFVLNHVGRNASEELTRTYHVEEASVLGRGACGSVVAVKHRTTGELYAMKVISIDTVGGTLEELKKEIDLQKRLDHPNICKIFESYEDRTTKEVFIIMEICTGGSLVSRMKTHRHGYGERAAATLIEKMLSSIIYCHHHGVVHRDIKLDNFIYEHEGEDAELKLIDFGFACEIQPGKEAMWDQLGTPSYMAPELWSNDESQYDSSVDMWALGVVTFMLLSGKRPFHHQDKREKARMIRHDPLQFPSPEWDRVSSEAKDFCSALMQKKPRDRLSATAAVEHPWIKQASKLHAGDDAAHELAKEAHNNIIESLEAFCEADDLKKLALEVIAFSTPPAKLAELRDIFVKIDVNDSGTISMQEFKDAMALHPEVPRERVEQMFMDMDIDGSGEVDYSEFLSATLSAQKHSNASILAAFNTLDADGDGFITKQDLVKALDGQMDEKKMLDMLQHADSSGRVNFQVFKKLLLHGLKASESSPTRMVAAAVSNAADGQIVNPHAAPAATVSA